jgi:uncharacterized protein YPO0396
MAEKAVFENRKTLNGFDKLNNLFRNITGKMEDLSANDAEFGYPNLWQDMMTIFDEKVKELNEMEAEYYSHLPTKYKKIFNESIDEAIEQWPERLKNEEAEGDPYEHE